MPTTAYIICGTPRSGSTLLCDLLAGTAAAGRPNSYFRPPSITEFATRMGIPIAAGTEGVTFDRAYLAAVLEAGRAGTALFGLRLMWDAVADLSRRLARGRGAARRAVEGRFQARTLRDSLSLSTADPARVAAPSTGFAGSPPPLRGRGIPTARVRLIPAPWTSRILPPSHPLDGTCSDQDDGWDSRGVR